MLKKILFIFALFAAAFPARAEKGVNIYQYSREVPDTNLYSQYGKAVRLKDFKGDFLIAVFWSKSCIPCIRELDDLAEFVQKTKDTGIKVILVSPAEDWANEDEQKAFLKRYGAKNIDFYVERNGQLSLDFGIFSTPNAILINAESMEIGRIRGSVDWDDKNVIEYIYKIKAKY